MGDEISKKAEDHLNRFLDYIRDEIRNDGELSLRSFEIFKHLIIDGPSESIQQDFVYKGLSNLVDNETGPNYRTRFIRYAEDQLGNRSMSKEEYKKWHHEIRLHNFLNSH